MTRNAFTHAVRQHADGLTVTATVSGDWDMLSDGGLVEQLRRLLDEGVRYIVIDAAQLDFCDSTRLGALVGLHQATAERGGWLRIVAPTYAVRRPLELTGLDQVIDIRDADEQDSGITGAQRRDDSSLSGG